MYVHRIVIFMAHSFARQNLTTQMKFIKSWIDK